MNMHTPTNHKTKQLNIGIIGFGKMGRIRADAIVANGGGIITAAYDTTPSRIPSHIPSCPSPEAIIHDPDIHAVILCTPNHLTREFVRSALAQGKHVFAEKPPGISVADAEAMQLAAQQAPDLKLKFGFNHRYHDAIMTAKKRIMTGDYGKILWLRGRYGKSVDSDFKNTWRADIKQAGGGILLDQGIHMLDLFVHLLGNFDEVKAFCNKQYWGLDIEDNVFAMFRNQAGQTASLHSTMTQWRHLFSLEIFLERGYMVINGILSSSGAYTYQGGEELTIALNRSPAPQAKHSQEERIVYKDDLSFQREIDEFMTAITTNQPILHGTPEDAVTLMRLIERIYNDDTPKA